MIGLLALLPLETVPPSVPPIDPNVAKPGGTALLVTVLLLLALVVLYLSLRKQLRKIQVPKAGAHEEGADEGRSDGEASSVTPETPSEGAPKQKATHPDSP